MTHIAKTIASQICENCAAYDAGHIDRAVWSTEQNRLWTLAAEAFVASDVMRLVAPSLAPRVPPYAVRRQLRDATLAIGR